MMLLLRQRGALLTRSVLDGAKPSSTTGLRLINRLTKLGHLFVGMATEFPVTQISNDTGAFYVSTDVLRKLWEIRLLQLQLRSRKLNRG
jgi:hypothetical protein